MRPQKILELFEDLADRLEIRIVHGKGDFQGGPCLVKGENVIVVNKQKPIEQRLRILAQGFGSMDLTGVYLKPVLRSYIDEIQQSLFNEKS